MPYDNRNPKRDHNFDNHPCARTSHALEPDAGKQCAGEASEPETEAAGASAAQERGEFPKIGVPNIVP